MPWAEIAVATGVGTSVLGFISAVLHAILQGKLVTAATHDMVVGILKDQLQASHEREKLWQESHGELESTLRAITPQLSELATLGETTVALLRALPPRQS